MHFHHSFLLIFFLNLKKNKSIFSQHISDFAVMETKDIIIILMMMIIMIIIIIIIIKTRITKAIYGSFDKIATMKWVS